MRSFRKKIIAIDIASAGFLFPIAWFLGTVFPNRALALAFGAFFLQRAVGVFTVALILRPIVEIFLALKDFREGKEEFFQKILLQNKGKKGEFHQLAFTINALTRRIRRQIENLTRQKEETKGILESLAEGIIAIDTDKKVIFANDTAKRFIRSCESEAKEKNALKSLSYEILHETLRTQKKVAKTCRIPPFFFDLIATPLADSKGALLVLQDKSSDYQVIEMGKDFIANASHELRTPITIIKGFAETLQDAPNLSKKLQGEITQKIVKTCERLDKLVRSLLTLADVENFSEKRLKSLDVTPLIENCVHWVSTTYPEAKIEVKNPFASLIVLADADLLELAIGNLLENGIKYSKENPEVEIEVRMRGKTVEILVKDAGIGIRERDLERIFDRFFTIDRARSRKSGGAGLGLSIVKTIIEKHKGTIRAKSSLCEGSTFTVRLPLSFR